MRLSNSVLQFKVHVEVRNWFLQFWRESDTLLCHFWANRKFP